MNPNYQAPLHSYAMSKCSGHMRRSEFHATILLETGRRGTSRRTESCHHHCFRNNFKKGSDAARGSQCRSARLVPENFTFVPAGIHIVQFLTLSSISTCVTVTPCVRRVSWSTQLSSSFACSCVHLVKVRWRSQPSHNVRISQWQQAPVC